MRAARTEVDTRVPLIETVQLPSSSPKEMWMSRGERKDRPSTRMPSWRQERVKSDSVRDGSSA